MWRSVYKLQMICWAARHATSDTLCWIKVGGRLFPDAMHKQRTRGISWMGLSKTCIGHECLSLLFLKRWHLLWWWCGAWGPAPPHAALPAHWASRSVRCTRSCPHQLSEPVTHCMQHSTCCADHARDATAVGGLSQGHFTDALAAPPSLASGEVFVGCWPLVPSLLTVGLVRAIGLVRARRRGAAVRPVLLLLPVERLPLMRDILLALLQVLVVYNLLLLLLKPKLVARPKEEVRRDS